MTCNFCAKLNPPYELIAQSIDKLATFKPHNRVATAKHCITETGARGSIIYGTNDNTKTDNMVNFTIDDVIFNQFGYVDVVLIRTREAMKLVGKGQSGPQPIKLPRGVSEQPVEGDKVVVAGWGFSCGGDKNCDDQDLLPTTLQQVEILVVKPVCFYLWDTLLFGPNQVDTLLCASGPQMHGTFPQDSCAGDSGGPLECTDASGDKYLCGIVSMGPNPPQCGRSPGGYTMVNIDCVRLFLQSRGNQFAGEEMSTDDDERLCGSSFWN
ncbi:serine protease 55-like [Symsagittifera roscoffensis]|uniref:serine protease 55-like n=1 Tax=Symsagittifera roscoffensis TaxID=84072 RepID=UPI00307C1DB6